MHCAPTEATSGLFQASVRKFLSTPSPHKRMTLPQTPHPQAKLPPRKPNVSEKDPPPHKKVDPPPPRGGVMTALPTPRFLVVLQSAHVPWYDALWSLYSTWSIFTLPTVLRRVILFGLAAVIHTHAASTSICQYKGGGAVIDSSYRLKNPKFDDLRFPYRLKL